MSVSITIRGRGEVERFLREARKIGEHVVSKGLTRCGRLVVNEAKKNAPISPTKKQYSATLVRKKRTSRRGFTPGGLVKSIQFEVKDGTCTVFVGKSSPAGKYARYIHDEKGKRWWMRGPGTIAKGKRADEKFITRALKDCDRDIGRILTDELRKGLRGHNGNKS